MTNNIDIRCLPSPSSPQFVNCPHKVTTAAWYIENDGVIDEYDLKGEWKEYLTSILEDDIWINKNNPGNELRTYSDDDIQNIIELLEENNIEQELLDFKENYPELVELGVNYYNLRKLAIEPSELYTDGILDEELIQNQNIVENKL